MTESKEKLFSEFPPVSTDEWMAKITADLKGAPFEKKMVWKTGEGFGVNPFYRSEDIEGWKTASSLPGVFPYVRGTKRDNDWKIRQDIDVRDFRAANARALDLLQKGVTSLGFRFAGEGVKAENIAALLEGICPEAVELNFSTCPGRTVALIALLADYLAGKGVDAEKCCGSIGYSPFGRLLKKGLPDEGGTEEAAAVLEAAGVLPGFRALSVDAYLFCDAGAYLSQELGYALAWGSEIVAQLSDAGFAPGHVARKIKFNFGISSNYFMEIAKFRAARWLWAEIVAAYGTECACDGKMSAHARTSGWNLTIYDAYVNLLRTQTETMSAALAGVDSITVSPFDSAYRTPDDFSERIARNQQLLLKEECHFDKVVDPSAGSYYIEMLTDSLAQAAWNLFLETEDRGGFYAAATSGAVQQAVNASSLARRKAVATRREILLGSNQYPNFTETAASKIADNDDACRCTAAADLPALDFRRGASEFEELRLATERSGRTPKVFMLAVGNLAMRLARSQFSCNFFACAGYRVIDNLGFETVEAGVEAALQAEAEIVVLCSSDDEYAEYAPAAFKALDGRAEFVVAGAPACADDLRAQGIKNFINIKSNVLDTLREFNRRLIKPQDGKHE
ncbi:MAG: methylmalonyl-CoA mutase small subunit [Tannerella sp.]|jgi:methylmalonyl-CoA mutase|nr:methylmalonyl-CoA mutase small subunit [Tannerella sp.]